VKSFGGLIVSQPVFLAKEKKKMLTYILGDCCWIWTRRWK